MEYPPASAERLVRRRGPAAVPVTYHHRITMAQSDTDGRRRLLARLHVKKDGRWQKHREIPGALPEKAADSGLPAGALRRKCHAELSLPRPQHGRAGHRDADAEGHRGAPETAHPGEVLP